LISLDTAQLVNWQNGKWTNSANMAYFRISCEEITNESSITIESSGGSSSDSAPGYTNQIPISINNDGSVYGYQTDKRLNSSGEVTDSTSTSVTGFIPIKKDDVIRFANMGWVIGDSQYSYCYIWCYDTSFTKVTGVAAHNFTADNFANPETDSDGNLTAFTINGTKADYSTIAYIRVSYRPITGKTAVITVNELI
jgi:hypothetical protein